MLVIYPRLKLRKKKIKSMRHQVDRFDGACLIRNVIYQATVFPENQGTKTYIGMTKGNSRQDFVTTIIHLATKIYIKHITI